jgi:hypothetical protein
MDEPVRENRKGKKTWGRKTCRCTYVVAAAVMAVVRTGVNPLTTGAGSGSGGSPPRKET